MELCDHEVDDGVLAFFDQGEAGLVGSGGGEEGGLRLGHAGVDHAARGGEGGSGYFAHFG